MKPPIRTSLLLMAALALPASQAQQGYSPPDVNYTPPPKAAPKPAPTGPSEAEIKAKKEAQAQAAKVKELERKLAAHEQARRDAELALAAEKKRKADEEAQRKREAQAAAAERERLAREAAGRMLAPKQVIQDCPDCPKMVVIAADPFTMGSPDSPDSETGRDNDEGPQHTVRVDKFLMGQTEVTVAQFRRFVDAKGYQTEAERNVGNSGCHTWEASDAKWDWRAGRSWRKPGWDVKDNEPVTCVSWNDAQAYVAWLSEHTKQPYQLPTEAQWEYAARAGTSTSRYWGDDLNLACAYANVPDQTKSPSGSTWVDPHKCNDGYWFVAPVANYRPNKFELYDMLGNVWEWTADCYKSGEYQRRKNSGVWLASKTSDDKACSLRVLRGGSWDSYPRYLRAASRGNNTPSNRDISVGFRLARMLPSGS